MNKTKGRPKKDLIKDRVFKMRLNIGERAMLDSLCESKGMNRSEIMRKALKNYYNQEKSV